jgi:hypothetical protein
MPRRKLELSPQFEIQGVPCPPGHVFAYRLAIKTIVDLLVEVNNDQHNHNEQGQNEQTEGTSLRVHPGHPPVPRGRPPLG